ncbi:2-hydroxyacyl-CoA dehydratase [Ihubacter massiliensis]|uniref:2-hydroxyacyl-CoA dehydratase n=1 Tax=Ihubacter massiliensis TaxID=1852367 RepID=UPI0020978837|nr:2-hydroxyacyl-CoA dehydratase [Ihubacter massiliensis]MCO7120928.1 2-hydroxyacyl-CoA dehydratase [Ihubacter massiliensis]
MRLGIDVGSTTVKLVLLDESGTIIYSRYERHMSNVFETVVQLLQDLHDQYPQAVVSSVITGSGGLSLSQLLQIPFEQEVVTCSRAVETLIPQTDVAIELGGEDAKITFYGQTIEQRMNGTCAGGTGAFIDQMAVLLNTDASGLNEAAKSQKMIYPIAARCGVFAKTDIQPLINEGAGIEDLSASIFQAVVNQTISGLACGRTIKGKVAFLGGPLSFLSELRRRFIETLDLSEEDVIFPENSKYFVAIGAAMTADKYEEAPLTGIVERIEKADQSELSDTRHIEPLFQNHGEYEEFVNRHRKDTIKRKDIKKARGKLFLGIDAGSTTTKAALIDNEKHLLYSFYKNNEGKPIEAVMMMLKELYAMIPKDAFIANSTVTGYGEGLIKAAFKVDLGEIETMAHYKGAEEFLPGVEFILDIGGQDMKCMKIKDNAIYNIMLNEACSSGCGSFIETYAKSVNMDVQTFAREALFAKAPVDLGTRCTVFMNSKVKQAQKEGATIGDISAGLSYSVIKNALYKVIKLRNPEDAGQKIVVQGGTFLNDAVLRSIEKIIGKDVVRPDISGIMGAYGAAVIARENYVKDTESSILKMDEMDSFTVENTHTRCKGCENNCLLTINKFNDGSRFITGNRCEKGEGKTNEENKLPNLYEYKFKRLFSYTPLTEEDSTRGTIGIPRVLNMYENYPFWFVFFTELGFRVQLSPPSSKELYESGMETISSDTACYPAKLVHGHIKWLVDQGVKWIFYPSINYERIEDPTAPNHYNCPIVATYPEVIAGNMDDVFEENGVTFSHPFIPYDNDEFLAREMYKVLKRSGVTRTHVEYAVKRGRQEDKRFRDDLKKKGEYSLKYARDHKKKAIVLAGRPYHLDPEINHGIDQIISSFDMVVVTEDSIAHLGKLARPLRVLDQWMYHSRLYKAATFVGTTDDVELVQLNSFGCGLDAVTTDQVEEITKKNNKLYTVLKIDEGSNLGAARIRIRSLKAAMDEREKNNIQHIENREPYKRKYFTKEMRKDYTLLIPEMSPMHFQFMETALKKAGYNAVLLPTVDKNAVDEGLKYINNDACYPTIVTLGQIISYLKSGAVDLDRTAVFMSQTGGGCRASNYVSLLRKALKDMDMEQIPVVSVNMAGLESNPGFKLSAGLIKRMLMAMVYGDVFMRVLYATRPYEEELGSANALFEKWSRLVRRTIYTGSVHKFKKFVKEIVKDFDALPLRDVKKPKVGVVGEILVKYHPNANNDIVGTIEREGGEAVVLDLVDFFLYGMYSKKFNFEHLSGTYKSMLFNAGAIKAIEYFRKPAREALRASVRFEEPMHIEDIAAKASEIISLGNQCGEGWLLTGEMVDLIDSGVENIVCMQPFACLPNHVTGKGMMKAMRKRNPLANIAAIDYDPGASDVNQLNRIKLMMATAYKNMEKTGNGGFEELEETAK